MNGPASFEQLNALVDRELDRHDEAAVLDAAQGDPRLQQRVDELRNAKALVRHAYRDVVPPNNAHRGRRSTAWRRVLAAACVLIVTAGAGWWLDAAQSRLEDPDIPRLAQRANAVAQIASPDRIVLHISSSAPARLTSMLDDAEDMLRAARAANRDVAIEIVANSSGLNVLRTDGPAQVTGRLSALRAEFPNLTLVACAQTIERLREKGITVHLLPDTTVASSALDEVVRRMHEGWTYVRT